VIRREGMAEPGEKESRAGDLRLSAIPSAGMIRIRFNGYDLRPYATPAKYASASSVYRRRAIPCQGLPVGG
jgi:hypothetical protein